MGAALFPVTKDLSMVPTPACDPVSSRQGRDGAGLGEARIAVRDTTAKAAAATRSRAEPTGDRKPNANALDNRAKKVARPSS